MSRWVRGDHLPPIVRVAVLQRFVHRWTRENAHRVAPANRPSMPLTSDAQWLGSHCFRVTQTGRLDLRYGYCEPDYLHPEED